MAVEDLKEARHATHLLINVFFQLILLLHYPRRHVLISRKIRTSLYFFFFYFLKFSLCPNSFETLKEPPLVSTFVRGREKESMGF